MSVIGPRPGLWNQDILTAERDKYNANDVKPGLTGWAQINGRDEIEISEKAKLDRLLHNHTYSGISQMRRYRGNLQALFLVHPAAFIQVAVDQKQEYNC